jgi:hypothetical protein
MSVDWTVEQTAADALRARGVETDIADAELHKLALAAVGEIAHRGYGPREVAFVAFGTGSLVTLDPPAASVTAIEEEGIALVADTDYRLRPGGLFLERLYGNYPIAWYGRVTGAITAAAADERYDRVVTDLVQLALEYSGLARRADGDYREDAIGSRAGGTAGGYQEEREALIEELAPAGMTFA